MKPENKIVLERELQEPFVTKTIRIREDHYNRLRREAFYQDLKIKDVIEETFTHWIENNQEKKPIENIEGFDIAKEKALLEKRKTIEALQVTENRQAAADLLKISRVYLNKLMNKYKISRDIQKKNKL
jgi:DNA-binding NtrC family response regulator